MKEEERKNFGKEMQRLINENAKVLEENAEQYVEIEMLSVQFKAFKEETAAIKKKAKKQGSTSEAAHDSKILEAIAITAKMMKMWISGEIWHSLEMEDEELSKQTREYQGNPLPWHGGALDTRDKKKESLREEHTVFLNQLA